MNRTAVAKELVAVAKLLAYRPMRRRTWHNVEGSYLSDVADLPRHVQHTLLPLFPKGADPTEWEMELFFTSSGSYDPGVIDGPIERSYPPEHDDERKPVKLVLTLNGKEGITDKGHIMRSVFDDLYDKVMAEELEDDYEYEPPDRDDY